MSDIVEGTWKGDPEALRKARENFSKAIANECISMASSYFSFIKVYAHGSFRDRVSAWKYAFLSRLLLAIAATWRDLSTFSPDQLSVMAGVYGKLSLTRIGLEKALKCAELGTDMNIIEGWENTKPHTVALNWADRAVLTLRLTKDAEKSMQHADNVVYELSSAVLNEPGTQGRRQLSRAYQKIGPIYIHHGNRQQQSLGQSLLRDAKMYTIETGATSQLSKIERTE